MKNTRSKSTISIAIIGTAIFVLVLAVGTVLTGLMAKKDTEKAVESVSLLYLDELAGRREQVVAENLSKKIDDMKIALELMNHQDDLSDMEHLQAYQAKMKRIYNLEKFAFVDEDGLIYTSLGTQTNIGEYNFDYKTITGPEISVLNPESSEKKVIIAIPVDDMFLDGIDVARQIRMRYAKETTVIILTSFNWDEIMEEAIHAGVDSFLAKPLFASNVIDEFERIARKNSISLFREKSRAELKGRRILMDVRMPEMDGLEATEAIRALGRPDAAIIPVIAMTANAFDEDVQRSLQVGMNAHLSKPVEPERLYQTLEELIWEYDQAKDNA